MGRILLGLFLIFCVGSLVRFTGWVLERGEAEREVTFSIERQSGKQSYWESESKTLSVGDISENWDLELFAVPAADGRQVQFAVISIPPDFKEQELQRQINAVTDQGAEAIIAISPLNRKANKALVKKMENLDWIFSQGEPFYQSNTDLEADSRLPIVFKDRYRSPVLVLSLRDARDHLKYRGLWNRYGGFSAYAFERD